MNDAERKLLETFEEEAKLWGYDLRHYEPSEPDERIYVKDATTFAWKIWKAAYAHALVEFQRAINALPVGESSRAPEGSTKS